MAMIVIAIDVATLDEMPPIGSMAWTAVWTMSKIVWRQEKAMVKPSVIIMSMWAWRLNSDWK